MSDLRTLARPYAKAAFEVAEDQGRLPEWGAALEAAAAVVADPVMADWLASPELDGAQAQVLILEAVGEVADDTFRRFLGVLSHYERLPLLGEISELYDGLREKAENRLDVRVVSAVPLAEDQASRLREALARRFERTVELHNEVDGSVVGGAVIYAGDEVIDGSVRGRLERLQQSLQRSG
jgi:F-type H+-transporting ATPase subunit delta